jgi:hypothetical protein
MVPFVAAIALVLILLPSNTAAQQVIPVNTASDGTPGNGEAATRIAALDDTGRYVVFADTSTNLVAGDGNGSMDVFVKDRNSNATTRVSVASDGAERTGSSGAAGVDMSGDGRIVVFTSTAAFAANDTNTCGDPAGPCQDVYVHDRATGQTTRVSVASDGTQANGPSELPAISRNGRYVAFTSHATNLVAADTNAASDVFVHDRVTGATTRVSVSTAGAQGGAGLHSLAPRINEDGTIVAFLSSAIFTDAPDPFTCAGDVCRRAYVHDRTTGTTVRVPMERAPQIAPYPVTVGELRLDASGRWVGLIVENTPRETYTRVVSLLYDRVTGQTLDVHSQTSVGGVSYVLALSGDGTVVHSNIWVYSRTGFRTIRLDRTNGHEYKADGTQYQPSELSFTGDIGVMASVSGSVYVLDYDSDDDDMDDLWEWTFGLDTTVANGGLDPDGDGATNLQEHEEGGHPRGFFKRYLAEGAVNAFFSTRLALLNPNTERTAVSLRFLGTTGLQSSRVETLQRSSRHTLNLTPQMVPEDSFSTVIESDRQVVVDRTMTWDNTSYGGHAETALEAPATTWHFAEGATHGPFSLFYLLQNPNDTDASVTVNYLRLAPDLPVAKNYVVPAKSRMTIAVDGEGPELQAADLAARIDSTVPIIAERAMYATGAGQQPFAAGHGGAGVTETALKWFLAEGATGPFFDLYVLVSNPNPAGSDLRVTYLFPSGEPLVKSYFVGPNNRLTISVDQEDVRLDNTPVSVVVESINNQPVVVERAMWWPSPFWHEAHLSAGTTTSGTKWALAEGDKSDRDVETYILIANTGAVDGSATVSFVTDSPATSGQITVPLAANTRTTLRTQEISAVYSARFGTIVESDGVPIVVERAMYRTTNGVTWSIGTSAVATKLQ